MTGRVPCTFCGKPTEGNYREITGWEQLRVQGGANKVIQRRETGRHCCKTCAIALKAGRDPAQRGMF